MCDSNLYIVCVKTKQNFHVYRSFYIQCQVYTSVYLVDKYNVGIIFI